MSSDLREYMIGVGVRGGWRALRLWGFVGVLVCRPEFSPAWCLGHAGEDGAGTAGQGIAGDTNDLGGAVRVLHHGG
jgi:hypothetical protein